MPAQNQDRVGILKGLFRGSNPGPLRPKRRIIPLDQTASAVSIKTQGVAQICKFSPIVRDLEKVENLGIDPSASRMLSERSTI